MRSYFKGDRLEALYDDVPSQYYGIYFNQAEPSVIDYAVIKNGTSGIHVFNEGNNQFLCCHREKHQNI